MSDTVKIKTSLGFTYSIESHDDVHDTGIPCYVWDTMPADERQKIMDDHLETEISNYLDCSVEVVDDEDE